MQATEERLAKLERVARWQRFGLVAIALVAGVAMLSGADDGEREVLTARELVITDAAGKPVGYFGNNATGTTLSLFRKYQDEKHSVRLGATKDGSSVTAQFDARRCVVSADAESSSVVSSGAEGLSALSVASMPMMYLGDKKSLRVRCRARPDTSETEFALLDGNERVQLSLNLDKKGNGSAGIANDKGDVEWKAP